MVCVVTPGDPGDYIKIAEFFVLFVKRMHGEVPLRGIESPHMLMKEIALRADFLVPNADA
jgi:hypothetical protein